MAQNFNFEQSLYQQYDFFKENRLQNRFFKHSDIMKLIENLKKTDVFQIQKVGESFENKEIYLLKIGTGKKKIFLWSQMHGDEPTATAALFDVFNFFTDTIYYNDVKRLILNNSTIFFLPLVNPDGTDQFNRRNSMMIDLNRDANKLESPEAKLLMNLFDLIKADFGFNLHDQSHRFSVGNSPKQATISFLAPPIDYNKSVDSVRLNSMKLISGLYELLNKFIPGHISKYSDDYEPRAFGDNFQRKGTRTILVESGGWKNDPEKQFIRKLNFILLLSAFKQIADGSFSYFDETIYNSIPFNEERLYDLVLRNLSVSKNGKEYKIDLAINYEEILLENKTGTYLKSQVENIGDLSTFYGIEDYDFSGYQLDSGKTFSKVFSDIKELKKIDIYQLLYKGYTNILLKNSNSNISFLPFNILTSKIKPDFSVKPGNNATFVLKRNNKIEYSVINGFIQNLKTRSFRNNGLVF
jgi:hypothetical protein